MKRERRWRLWVEGEMAGSSALFSVIWRLCVSQRVEQREPGRSMPGQDLSLLPTSSPCAAAKPPLGKGLNFGFGCPLFPTLCHYAAQIEKTAQRQRRMERDRGKKRGEDNGKACLACMFWFLLNIF